MNLRVALTLQRTEVRAPLCISPDLFDERGFFRHP